MWLLNLRRNNLFLILVIILSLPSIFSLFNPGFFQSDDGEWMIIRFSAFHQALVGGQFPVRWLGRLNHEYGYPVANFLYPGFMYLAEIPKILGSSFVDSIKIIIGLSMLASSIFTYLWLNKIFDKLPAIIGALFYLYAPYHLFDLYKRGSVGEILALSIVPFILWQIERGSILWSTLGIAFLLLSHNTLAVLFIFFIFFYMILNVCVSKKRRALMGAYAHMIIVGFLISSFFWVPAIADLQHTIFFQTSVSEWNKYFVGLDLIGLPTLFIFFLIVALLLYGKIEVSQHRLTIVIFLIGIVSLFFSTSISAPLWDKLPVSFIQFPFRFLSVVILCTAFLVAFVVSISSKRLRISLGISILLFTVLLSRPFIIPAEYVDRGEGFYATNMDTTTVKNEYMPKWVKILPVERPKEKVEILNGKATIEDLKIKNHKTEFNLKVSKDALIRLNIIFFPGWKAFIDGKESPISFDNDKGVMDINVLQGNHNIKFYFGETPVRLASDTISLVSLVILSTLFIKRKYEFF